ncbi:MAG: NADH-quinone oxidoreductase subunit NuoH [Thermoplasmata archaeon]|nr:NADH-quinone oxidoreductase subunit NuoH [Thermoplasmata archaeon]
MDLYGFVECLVTKVTGWVDTWLPSQLSFLTSPTSIHALVVLLMAALILVIVLLNVVMMIWVERKFIARLMDRRGPTEVGFAGLLQNVADGLKLFLKEVITPRGVDRSSYVISIALYIGSSVVVLALIPLSDRFFMADVDGGIFMIFAIYTLAPFFIFIAGWSQNNKYSLIGGMRSAAQMISYEIPLMLSTVGVILMAGSLSISVIVEAQQSMWFVIPSFLGFIIFLIGVLAEVERIPFDLPEAEAELVEGWTTEYGGIRFGLIMFTSYLRGYVGCALATFLFLGGWNGPFTQYIPPEAWFMLKVYILFMLLVWLRASAPRIRIDQLLQIGWKRLLPLAMLNIVIAVVLLSLGVI